MTPATVLLNKNMLQISSSQIKAQCGLFDVLSCH
jgi:hypothetical protein